TRVDRDQAAFAQATWDITSQWELSGGLRYFKFDNTLEGFYGYNANLYGGGSGTAICFAPPRVLGTPCTDLLKRVAQSGHVPRGNLPYKTPPDAMVHATWSKGFRPGGVNRTAAPNIGPYQADFPTNWEIGWKPQCLNRHLRWNGAIFEE